MKTRIRVSLQRKHVAFAVQALRDYDGSLDEKSPLKDHTISFQTNDFIHIHTVSSTDIGLRKGLLRGDYCREEKKTL